MKKLFLSSSFCDIADLFMEFVSEDLRGKSVTFIPTASVVEEVDFYVSDAIEKFKSLGMDIDEIDISKASKNEIETKIKQNDFIYISGGNSFFLLQELKVKEIDKLLIEEINRGKFYIGESAGAIILYPNIEYIKDMDDCKKAPFLDNYDALNVTPFYSLPHYKEFPFEDTTDNIYNEYKNKLKLYPFSNSEAILVKANEIKLLK